MRGPILIRRLIRRAERLSFIDRSRLKSTSTAVFTQRFVTRSSQSLGACAPFKDPSRRESTRSFYVNSAREALPFNRCVVLQTSDHLSVRVVVLLTTVTTSPNNPGAAGAEPGAPSPKGRPPDS